MDPTESRGLELVVCWQDTTVAVDGADAARLAAAACDSGKS